MGGAVSVTMTDSKKRFTEGGLSSTFRKMQADGMDDKEIYKNLRETYGSLRLKKKITVNEGSVRALAIVQLSQTLESNRLKYNSDDPSSLSNYIHSSGSIASSNRRQSSYRDVNAENIFSLEDNGVNGTKPVPAKPKKPKLKILISSEGDEDGNVVNNPLRSQSQTGQKITPRGAARLSPSGNAVHIDGLAIHEKGIVAESGAGTSFLTSGRSEFVMIGSLGRGASGSVIEALHIPTLTIVALKMLPIYDADDLHHIAAEMSVLYQNLAKLKLIDNRLDDEDDTDAGSSNEEFLSEHHTHSVSALELGRSSDGSLSEAQSGSLMHVNSLPALSASSKTAPSVVLSSCKQVLAMYDAFLDSKSGMVNLVVEYMDGGSLQDVVEGGGCQDEEALADIAYQVLLGLDFLHRNNQMHRDIKPGNILLNCQGEVKLADFGIAMAVDTKGGFNQPNSFVGTMCYMAPERISNASYGTPGDIWSFGLTILAVVRGEFPLDSAKGSLSYWDLLRVICEEDPPELGSGYSNQFNMFINACLQQNPKDRPSVTMLLQHPFFVKHAMVVHRLSEESGRPITLSEAPSVSDDDDRELFTSFSDKSAGHSISIWPSSASSSAKTNAGNDSAKQTRLSRLTSRTKSYSAQLSQGHTESSSNIVMGEGSDFIPVPYSPGRSACDSDPDDDIMTAIRLEHLERVLEKTEAKYDHMVALYRREKSERKQQKVMNRMSNASGNACDRQGSGEGSNSAFTSGGSFRSMKSSRSFLKSANDPMTPVPNFTVGIGRWEHLAYQLQLPLEIVLSTAANILNEKYLARDE